MRLPDDDGKVHFPTGNNPRLVAKKIGKSTPPIVGPDDIRQMAIDALQMQDALIRIQAILKRPASSHQSLAMHHAYMLRDIHQVVNLPESDTIKRIVGE